MIDLMKESFITSETETESQTERIDWWLPRGREVGEGWIWEFRIIRYKLLNIE